MQTTCEDFKTSRAPTCPLRLPKSEDPGSSSSSTNSGCLTEENLRHHWENIVVECGIFDVGLLDPIEGARLLSEKTLWKKSCHGCAQLQHDIWTRIRENLWTKLGELVN
ncbi:hypothetical protein QCA50_005688 [Cerrena zonata]|uniref:Uncharacterized protein n=1 Tax=Cerrena zonata TaxID=2478898 RepID=A0AAW0GHB3_9APHY